MYQRHLDKLCRTRLDDVLLDEGQVDRSHVEDAAAEHEMTGRTLTDVLFERSVIDEWSLAKTVCSHYSLPFIDVTVYSIPKEALEALPLDFCRAYALLPLDLFGEGLMLAVAEMPSAKLLAEIRERSGLQPFLYVAVRRSIVERLAAAGPPLERPGLDWQQQADRLRKAGGSAHDPDSESAVRELSASSMEADGNPLGGMPVLAASTPPVVPRPAKDGSSRDGQEPDAPQNVQPRPDEAPKPWEAMFNEIDSKMRTDSEAE